MSVVIEKVLNITRPHSTLTYPTRIKVRRFDDLVHHLELQYMTEQDARISANEHGTESDGCIVHLFAKIVHTGSLIEALQYAFSCHYVESN